MLLSPEKVVEDKSEKTAVYHMQAVVTNRIKIISEDNIEECLENIINTATFVGWKNNMAHWRGHLLLKTRMPHMSLLFCAVRS